MPNTDTSSSARLRQVKAQTLANYRAQNPTAREGGGAKSADASVVTARAPGAYPVVRQTDSKPAQVTPACCGSTAECVPVTPLTTINLVSFSQTGNVVVLIFSWIPDPNATSYTFSSNSTNITFSDITLSTVTITDNTPPNEPEPIVTITAVNVCSSASNILSEETMIITGNRPG
jgi:hypothetical protein